MSEVLDKLERARFLAALRLRREDAYGSDVLDHALLMESALDGAVSLHCPMTPEGDSLDLELGEIPRAEAHAETEEALAEKLAGLVREALDDGTLPRYERG